MILQQYSNQGTLTISMVSLRKNSTDEFTEGKQTKMLINYVFSTWCENYGEIYLMKILLYLMRIYTLLHSLNSALKVNKLPQNYHRCHHSFRFSLIFVFLRHILLNLEPDHLSKYDFGSHCCTGLWISINKLLNIWEERDVYHIFIWIYRYDINK